MSAIDIILFLGACVGHIAILSFSNNWWFARPLPHRLLTGIRLLHGVVVAGGLAGFALAYPLNFSLQNAIATGSTVNLLATVYTALCAVIGLLWLPLITVVRLVRPKAAVLLSNHTHMVDIATELGHKPVGRGKYHLLAKLPGNQIFQVEFSVLTLQLPRLPLAWDGLSILHISDLHLCGTPDKIFYQRVMDFCRDWEPDLVAFTGDTVDSETHYRWILPVLGKLRWRVAGLAVLGNHDSCIGSVLVPSRYGRRYDCGTFWVPPTALHVSRGLAGQHPLRFNCRPEVSKLILRIPEQTLSG